jgi:uncharacterized phage protein (TIGR02218 family)
MKQLDPLLAAHLQQSVTTLAWCWKITRTDQVTTGYTSFDQNLTIDGLTYKAATGFFPSAIAQSNQLDVDNQELNSVLDDDGIREQDLVGGKYDFARMDLFLVNYLDLPSSLALNPPRHVLLISGVFGEVSHSDRSFKVEARSKAQLLAQKIVEQTSPTCRYRFGDADCTVDMSPYQHSFEVVSIAENRIIEVGPDFYEPSGYFDQGELTFESGANEGITYTIQRWDLDTRTIALFETAYYPILLGNGFSAIAGCDKTLDACKRYGNFLNFGGEPHVPGADKIFAGFTG